MKVREVKGGFVCGDRYPNDGEPTRETLEDEIEELKVQVRKLERLVEIADYRLRGTLLNKRPSVPDAGSR